MLLGEQTRRRAQALANALNVGLEIKLGPSPSGRGV